MIYHENVALRIFHIPSHMDYVQKLTTARFQPVTHISGSSLRVAELLMVTDWDSFDIVHVHTVELATLSDFKQLRQLCTERNKRLVVTIHDLEPHIEKDFKNFIKKISYLLYAADALLTLTTGTADRICRLTGVDANFTISPHGRVSSKSMTQDTNASGFAVFGGFRPNRSLIPLVQSWSSPRTEQAPLRVLIRSFSQEDATREKDKLSFLKTLAHNNQNFTLTCSPGMVEEQALVDWLSQSQVLVLPYSSITHSGQLELACDLNMSVLAPNVSGLKEQLSANKVGKDVPPIVWFPPAALEDDTFNKYLAEALEIEHTPAPSQTFRAYRDYEHTQIADQHEIVYLSTLRTKV